MGCLEDFEFNAINSNVTRDILCLDSLQWLADIENNELNGSVFTSLPDIIEIEQYLFKQQKNKEIIDNVTDNELKESLKCQI